MRVTEALYTWAERPEVRKGLIAVCEWATVDSRLQGYRERWAQDGVPISLEEAEYALHCLGYAAFNEQVEPIQYLMSTLVKTPSEDAVAGFIERAESKAPYWDALMAYKESRGSDISPMLSEWPPNGVERPNGRGRPRRWIFRDDVLIPKAIRKFEDCGLPVTSVHGPSIAVAVARVFGLSERNVARIWELAPNRSDKSSRYSDQPCQRCGCLKVPMYRHHRREFLCASCLPDRLPPDCREGLFPSPPHARSGVYRSFCNLRKVS